MPVTSAFDHQELRAFQDNAEIIRICTLWAWLADRRDWAALLGVFTEEIDFDYTSLNGGEPLRLPRESVIDGFRVVLSGFHATQHLISNHLVTRHEGTAECTAAFLATHVLPNEDGEPTWTVGGHYDFTLADGPDGWRISGIKMTADWTAGNQELVHRAVANQPEHIKQWKHEQADQERFSG
jgi:3-phenylpropionate/cinnamic acid dioxygenase small subunit